MLGDITAAAEIYIVCGYTDYPRRIIIREVREVFLANLFRFKRLAVRNKEICHAVGVFQVRWATT